MIVLDAPELDSKYLDVLATRYKLKQKRLGIHLSTLIYCLTKAQFDLAGSAELTESELMLFAIGYGLQEVLTPKEATTPVYETDGIMYSPDFAIASNVDFTLLNELKTTRQSLKRGLVHEFPETWIEYMKGGCYITGSNKYDLGVLYLMGNYRPPFPKMKSFHFIFEDGELVENWENLLVRKSVFVTAVQAHTQIEPYKWNKSWECEYCRFKLVCSAIGGKL